MDMLNEFQGTYNELLIRKAEKNKIPIMGTFELTPICNMKCNMCYIQQNKKDVLCKGGLKSIDFWEKTIDEAIENGLLFCLLTGGEIFTYPHFRELYEKLKTKGIHIVLNTNGTLLDEETVKWLAKNPPRRLNISLYGGSEETYEKLCHYKEGFNKVITAFELLNKYQIPFRVHGVMVPSNIEDYDKIKKICNYFKVPLELTYYMFPPVRKEMKNLAIQERFSPSNMANVAFMYRKDQCGEENDIWGKYIESKWNYICNPQQNPLYNFNKVTCKGGNCSLWVNWKGYVSGCGVSDQNQYNLEEYSIDKAWNKIKEYTSNIQLSKKCAQCKYRCICPICMAGAYCETGTVNGEAEYLCEFSKAYAKLIEDEYKRLNKYE